METEAHHPTAMNNFQAVFLDCLTWFRMQILFFPLFCLSPIVIFFCTVHLPTRYKIAGVEFGDTDASNWN